MTQPPIILINHMFKRLFGKKNDGFYMQVEEPTTKDPVEKAPAAKAAVTPIPPPAAKVAAPSVAEVVVSTEPSSDPVESAKAKKTSIKEKKKKKSEKADKKTPPVVAPIAIDNTPAEPAFTNFATDYLIKPSSSSNRRRPGANMKQFMDMARQVEVKKNPGQRAKS